MTARELIETLPIFLENKWPVLISGMPGVGKSEVITHVAKTATVEVGGKPEHYELMILHLVTHDPVDAKGLPYFENGPSGRTEANFIPFGNMRRMIEATKPLIVFLDDLGQAPAGVQAAFMQLVLARELDGKKISDHVRFVAATNRRKDKAGVTGILTPLLSRFYLNVTLAPDLTSWLDWAYRSPDIHPVVPSYCNYMHRESRSVFEFNPSLDMENSPLPRTFAALGRMLKSFEDRGLKLPYPAIEGIVGSATAVQFNAFYQTWRELPDPDRVVEDPEGYFKEHPLNPKRPDVTFALISAVMNRITKDNIDNVIYFMTEVLSPEFKAYFTKEITTSAGPRGLSWIYSHEGFSKAAYLDAATQAIIR